MRAARSTAKSRNGRPADFDTGAFGARFNNPTRRVCAVAYQTAWFKANHPVEFYAASMSFDMGNADRIASFRRELQQEGIDLLPPDVNRSGVAFTVEEGAVRYALAALKNVGAAAMESLVGERTENGRPGWRRSGGPARSGGRQQRQGTLKGGRTGFRWTRTGALRGSTR